MFDWLKGKLGFGEIAQGITEIKTGISSLEKQVMANTAELERLKTEVAENEEVIGSAVVLIKGLAQQIRDLKDDPAELTALADRLDSKSKELGAAVAENTDSAPEEDEDGE